MTLISGNKATACLSLKVKGKSLPGLLNRADTSSKEGFTRIKLFPC